VAVLRYIAEDAILPFPPTQESEWYRIAEWGFNIGRQDCEVYLDNLFRMNREKQRNDSIFTALNTAAAAIITGTTHAQKPLSLVAAAFGLTTAINDALFQSYLFTEAPGLIAIKVKELQDAYRDSVEKNEYPDGKSKQERRSLIRSPEAAFNAIQNYYRLCLPQTIEGTLLQAVSYTTAKATDPGKDPKETKSDSAKSLNAKVTLEKKASK